MAKPLPLRVPEYNDAPKKYNTDKIILAILIVMIFTIAIGLSVTLK